MFDLPKDKENPDYQFKGMICYLGAHYVAFFRSVESDLENDIMS